MNVRPVRMERLARVLVVRRLGWSEVLRSDDEVGWNGLWGRRTRLE